MRKKRKKTKSVLMAGVKLNRLEKTISKALTDVGKFKIHEKFKVVNNEAVNYCRM